MKISCNVIRDILPLYAEDLASEDTKQLVDEHLCDCDSCTRELGVLKKVQMIPVDREVTGLKKVKKTIVIRRIVAVLTALLMVFSLYCCGMMLMDATIYLDAEDIVESVEATEDGSIRVHWKYIITGVGSVGEEKVPEGENTRNFGIICYNRLGNVLFPKEETPYEALPTEVKEYVSEGEWGASSWNLEGDASNWNFWYVDAKDGTGETLLWDAGHPHPDYPFDNNVNYHIFWYLLILLALTAVFALLSWKKILPKITRAIATAFGSVAFCVVVVTAGQFMELWGEFTECFVDSAITAIPVFATAMCIWQLHDWRRLDKGM